MASHGLVLNIKPREATSVGLNAEEFIHREVDGYHEKCIILCENDREGCGKPIIEGGRILRSK